ncbi:MAG TPA: histidinol-phosphate transaminase [Anaeromyxobacter sp.]|nr:histidinol-phosphate transaminase [Anaeromyxobacter sp.]
MNAFKPHLATVADYPYSKVDARVKLDQNESPEDFPADLKARALARLAVLPWNRYPELHAEEVRAAIARHEGWPEEGIVVSPGSNLLVLALAQGARSVLDTVPAFPYYKGGAAAAGTPYRSIPLGTDFALPADALLAAMEEPPGVLFLPNPHAPTGRLFEAGDVERLAARARERDWLLVVDEAYHAFAGTDARPLARGNPNVAVLRTFSKSWCLGGIRAGYLLAAPRVAAIVRALVPPFCIPAHTGAILLTALEAPDRFAPIHERIRAERARLFAGLASHPTWKPYPSAANYVLVRTPDAKAAFDGLVAKGILVRRQDHYPGLEGCIRVTVGAPSENDALLAAAAGLR